MVFAVLPIWRYPMQANHGSARTHANSSQVGGSSKRPANLQAEIARLETQVGAIEMGLRQLRKELADLQGFTLGGIVTAIFGQKASATARLRDQIEVFEQQEADAQVALTAMRDELSRLETHVSDEPPVACDRASS